MEAPRREPGDVHHMEAPRRKPRDVHHMEAPRRKPGDVGRQPDRTTVATLL
jgi:hypothetical protein